jgi:glycosyltransferase involved in cell wall biosynthesis
MKISYCTTCKQRLGFLQKTLPANLAAEEGNPDVEFVILDYDSGDGLREWLVDTYADLIRAGRIRYAYHGPAPHFWMSHAKNLAHLAATGDVLCSVDADNLLARDFSLWLREVYARGSDTVASPRRLSFWGYLRQRWIDGRLGLPTPSGGLAGRIAVSRELFHRLGGYDQTITAWGGEDLEFLYKARDAGAAYVEVPPSLWGSSIEHSDSLRTENLSKKDADETNRILRLSVFEQMKRRWAQSARRDRRPSPLPVRDADIVIGTVETMRMPQRP